MRYFKHKTGSFLFSQIKTLKTAEFKCKKKVVCFCIWIRKLGQQYLTLQYSQNCSAAIAYALCINGAKKVLNSDISCSNSGYNGVSIGISNWSKRWTNTFPSQIAFLQWRLKDKEQIVKKTFNLMNR